MQYMYYPISQEAKALKSDNKIWSVNRNIFLEKPYTKCDGETIPRLFKKKSKLSISLNQ